MSVMGIAGSALLSVLTQSIQSKKREFQQELKQLGQDLQSGNLTAAQSDYSTIQQDFQSMAAQGQSTHGHHHHHHGGGDSSSSSSSSEVSQMFNELGTALPSGTFRMRSKHTARCSGICCR